MNITLLPEKHVRTSECLLGLGALVLASIATAPKSLDTLWDDLKQLAPVKRRVHGSMTFDSLVLAVDFLFAVGAVRLNDEGLLEHASH
jgi:hypothetical protein